MPGRKGWRTLPMRCRACGFEDTLEVPVHEVERAYRGPLPCPKCGREAVAGTGRLVLQVRR